MQRSLMESLDARILRMNWRTRPATFLLLGVMGLVMYFCSYQKCGGQKYYHSIDNSYHQTIFYPAYRVDVWFHGQQYYGDVYW